MSGFFQTVPTAPAGDNTDYETRLARFLLSHMDAHEAIHVCQENGWEGLLRFVIALRRSYERSG
jgi:hypothetical protein